MEATIDTSGTTRAPATIMAALLGVLTLGGCGVVPGIPPRLGAGDVITIGTTAAGMRGYYGHGSVEFTADTATTRFWLPDGRQIIDHSSELDPYQRELLVRATEKYIGWQSTVPNRHPCTDIASDTVTVTGSVNHESSMQDCDSDSPLRALTTQADDATDALAGQLARPYDTWMVEIRPWDDETSAGADGPIERYTLTPTDYPSEGMDVAADRPPPDWGDSLPAGDADGTLALGYAGTGDVLFALNDTLTRTDQLGCGDPTGEIRMINARNPSITWTHRLCQGEHTDTLASVLRGL